jgi:MFS family permease
MKKALPVIVISQFFCCSSWFAINAIMPDLIIHFGLTQNSLAHLTSAVQLGFITGALVFALLALSDRFSPSKVFFICSLLTALFNMGLVVNGLHTTEIVALRFFTGFFLAGIYPVGMKIASDYYKEGLGKALGFLVGALVLGTAFPHFLRSISMGISWQYVLFSTSVLAVVGGSAILFFVPDGPYKSLSQKLKYKELFVGFKDQKFKAAAFGYFGHMWELYAFWTFLPLILQRHATRHNILDLNIPLLSFFIIASGSVACVLSGLFSRRFGTKPLAIVLLVLSCLCCLLSPLFFLLDTTFILVCFLLFWGMVVIADSPLFSTLVAQNAPAQSKGTSLTLVNSIGFAITIVSIQLLTLLSNTISPQFIYMVLGIGPLWGIFSLLKKEQP